MNFDEKLFYDVYKNEKDQFTVFCYKIKKDATIPILFYVTQLISIMTEHTYFSMFQMFHSPLLLDQSNGICLSGSIYRTFG